MQSFFFNNPKLLQWAFPSRIWRVPTQEKVIYLTFDDGPHPEITPWVLNELEKYNAKATFFLIGDNVRKYPEVKTLIQEKEHTVGNHTYNHWRSTKYSDNDFIANVQQASGLIESKLFRPPYGILFPRKAKKLIQLGYKIVMWDIITGDFDRNLSADVCSAKTLKYAKPGSVIVFHDSEKAAPNLKKALPLVLKKLRESGFRFEALPQ